MTIRSFVRDFLLPTLAVLWLAPGAAAGPQCGEPLLTRDDLRSWAREVSAPDRYSHYRAIRSALAMERSRTPLAGPSMASPAPTPPFASYADEWVIPNDAASAAENDHWLPGFGLPILDEYPSAAIEFRGELIVSGWLRTAGSHRVNGIARWTSRGWEPLGEGVIPAFALAVLGDRLIAASYVGPISAWDGHSWSELPAVPLDRIDALTVHDGVLYASGCRVIYGVGGERGRVAKFDGARWTVLGDEFDQPVHAIGFFRGALIAGGSFTRNGTTACGYVARFDGARWTALGGGIDPVGYSGVRAVEEYGDRLIVGGWFESCSGLAAHGLAVWDGATWSSLAGDPAAYVEDLLVANGKLYMAGRFSGEYSAVAVWDGSTFRGTPEPLGDWVLGLARFQGGVAAVGGFTQAGLCPSLKRMIGVAVMGPEGWRGLERWDTDMHGLASNVGAGSVESAVVYRGDPIVAGRFQLTGDPPNWKPLSALARWDGNSWQRLGSGVTCSASALAVVGEDLIAAGSIMGTSEEGPINGVARWDGAQWHAMGRGLYGLAFALAEYRGRIYVGGEFRLVATDETATLAVWDGVEWSSVPGAPNAAEYNTPRVSALEVWNGRLYAGGNFFGSTTVHSPSVVAWDGEGWHALGAGVRGEVRAFEGYRGDLYVAGFMSPEHVWNFEGLTRWDGSAWHSLGLEGSGVQCLATYDSKLVVGGYEGVDRFAPGSTGLVAWDGEEWSGFGAGVSGTPHALCQIGSDLLVGGRFSRAGTRSAFGIARWSANAQANPTPTPLPGLPPRSGDLRVASTVVTDIARLSYSLPEPGRARIELFDLRGARVAELMDREMPVGDGTLEWLPGGPAYPASGVYLVRLTLNGRSATGKVIFVR